MWHGPDGLQVGRVRTCWLVYEPSNPGIVRATSGTVGLAMTSTDAEDVVKKIKLYMVANGVASLQGRQDTPFVFFFRGTEILDYSKLDWLVVHRRLRTFEVGIRTSVHLWYHDVDALKTTVKNLVTETKNVGEALMPGGTAAEVDVEAGWPLENGVNCCRFLVDKV